jgi:hypothetical protein
MVAKGVMFVNPENENYYMKLATWKETEEEWVTGRTFARLPPEISSKLIGEKIATVTYSSTKWSTCQIIDCQLKSIFCCIFCRV